MSHPKENRFVLMCYKIQVWEGRFGIPGLLGEILS
jgi:hypothetical protein